MLPLNGPIRGMRTGGQPVSQDYTSTVSLANFKGGLNTVNKGLNLRDDQLAQTDNLCYFQSQHGVGLVSRVGAKRETASAAGAALKDLGFFLNSSGTVETLGVANSDLLKLVAGAWSKIGDLAGARGRGCQVGGKWVVADGSYLKFYDGSDLKMAWDSASKIINSVAGTASSQDLYSGGATRAGQKFTTPAWDAGFVLPVETVTAWISKTGSPTGNAQAVVRKVSDDSAVATSAARDVSAFEAAGQEEVFSFSAGSWEPSTAYYVAIEYGGGDASNKITVHYTSDTAADGNMAAYNGSWGDVAGDCYLKVSPSLPPRASIAVTHYNRVWTDDLDRFNWVRFSGIGDPCDWEQDGGSESPSAGYFIIDGAHRVTALVSFYDRLMVHFGTGKKSTHWISGSSSSDFARVNAIPGVGALNQDCVQAMTNDLVFLDSQGVVSLMAWDSYGDIEAARKSDAVANMVVPNATTDKITGRHGIGNLFLVDYGDSAGRLLAYDTQLSSRGRDARSGGALWSRLSFELGSGVRPSCFAELNDECYFGDSAGHLWHLDTKDPQYYDGPAAGLESYSQGMKTKAMDFGTKRTKQAHYAEVLARSKFGGSFKLKFYKDLSPTAFFEKEITLPFDPDLTLAEATFRLDDATMALDDSGSNLKLHDLNFEFATLQIGIEEIALLGQPLLIHGLKLHVAVLSRTT